MNPLGGEMSPRVTASDVTHHALRDGKVLSYAGLNLASLEPFEDQQYFMCRQLRVTIPFADRTAPLAAHIFAVGLGGSKEQVIVATARRVVASVEAIEPGRNRAVCGFVGDAVTQDGSPLAVFRTDTAVAVRVTRASPEPASIGLRRSMHLGIEAHEQRCASRVSSRSVVFTDQASAALGMPRSQMCDSDNHASPADAVTAIRPLPESMPRGRSDSQTRKSFSGGKFNCTHNRG